MAETFHSPFNLNASFNANAGWNSPALTNLMLQGAGQARGLDSRFDVGLTCNPEPPHIVKDCASLVGEGGQRSMRMPTVESDELVAVNDTRVENLDLRRVPHLLYGPSGSVVKLSFKAGDTNEIFHLVVRRVIPSGTWKIYDVVHRLVPPMLSQIQATKLDLQDQRGNTKDMYTEAMGSLSGGEAPTLGILLPPKGHKYGALQVMSVERGSPADLMGIREGDNIVSVDGKAASLDNIKALIAPKDAHLGSSCRLAMDRRGETYYVEVVRSAATRVRMTKDLLEGIIGIRADVAELVPAGDGRDKIIRSCEALFEHGVKMAKNRIEGEKNLSAKIGTLQKRFLIEITSVQSLLSSLPTPDRTLAEVEQMTESTASMHTKLSRLEGLNKNLQLQLDEMKKHMTDMSIEVGHWKDKAQKLQRRVDNFDNDALILRSTNSDLFAKVQLYECEFPKAVDAKRMMDDHRVALIAENTQLKGKLEGLRTMQQSFEEDAKAQKAHLIKLQDKCHALQRSLDEFRPVTEYCAEPRIEIYTLINSMRGAGLRVDEVVRLMGILKNVPPPVVDSIDQMAHFLRGPPRQSIYDIRQTLAQHNELKQRAEDEMIAASTCKAAVQREQLKRQDLEAEMTELKELARLSQKALEAWKPMIDFNSGPPSVSPQEMSSAMIASGSSAAEIVKLLKLMSGPPIVHVPELCDTIKVLFLEDGLRKHHVDKLWTKLQALRTARDANKELKTHFDQAVRLGGGRGGGSQAGQTSAPSEFQPSSRGVADHISSFNVQSRLKVLLDSHNDYAKSFKAN